MRPRDPEIAEELQSRNPGQYYRYINNVRRSQEEPDRGIVFITISDKITGSLAQYSVITFYVSIVFVAATVLRNVLVTGSEKLFISEMPHPDMLLILCEGIIISRLERNLEREEELYFVLMDIMRSPEIIKVISKSSIKKKQE